LSGSKLRRVCVALANRSKVRVDGIDRPLSRRATTACVVPIARDLFLCHVRILARLDQRRRHCELVLQRLISRDVFRILPPLLEGLLHGDQFPGHRTSSALLRAVSIRGVAFSGPF
jgi:hypothetical protein